MPLEIRSEKQDPCTKNVIALDPGIRTFMTGYDPNGIAYEFGSKDISKIYRLYHSLDKLQAKYSQHGVGHHKRWRMRKAGARIRKKIHNLIHDFHCKLSKFLCTNYHFVLLPSFESSHMVRKGQRRINRKTARAMNTWSHYKFQQRLIHKSREYPCCKVAIVNEAYTSKTCGKCGTINNNLAGNNIFTCAN